MTASLDTRVIVSAVSRLAAREVCDWAAVFLTGPTDEVVEAVGAHRDATLDATVHRVITARFPSPSNPASFVGRVLETGAPIVENEVTDELLRRVMADDGQFEQARRIGFRSVVVVPLAVRGRTLGALVTVRSPGSPPFEDDDVQVILELGRRAALALENARLYGEREYVAETLQRSLLPPDFPPIAGLELGARYQPASEGTSVGGDFYDVFEIDPGHWAAVIGDVVGKGPTAAAMMGLARYTIRTAAMGETRPSRILATLNEAILRQTSDQRFCTACCLRILLGDQGTRVTVSSGGTRCRSSFVPTGRSTRRGRPARSSASSRTPRWWTRRSTWDRGCARAVHRRRDGRAPRRRGVRRAAAGGARRVARRPDGPGDRRRRPPRGRRLPFGPTQDDIAPSS